MSMEYVPVKSGYRGKFINVPLVDRVSQDAVGAKVSTSKRVCIGGRGREWSPECFKVLEEMSKMSEAEIFIQPIDAIKYPEYYTLVADPIDLSKIQLKFHGGLYASMFTFVDDVHLMLNNHLLLYSDPTSSTHQDILKVQHWFDDEMEKIKRKWLQLNMPSSSIKETNNRVILPKRIRDRIDAIEAENRNIVGSPLIVTLPSTNSSQTASKSTRTRLVIRDSTGCFKPVSGLGTKTTPLVLTKLPPASSAEKSSCPESARSLFKIQFSKSANQQIVFSQSNNTSTSQSATSQNAVSSKSTPIVFIPTPIKSPKNPLILIPKNSTAASKEADNGGTSLGNESTNRVSHTTESLTTIDEQAGDQVVLVINASNVWFGGTQMALSRPIIVTDEGVVITCLTSSLFSKRTKASRNHDREVFQFVIKPDDLVKCFAYLGNSPKHTIFFSVFPNCVRRLQALVAEKLSGVTTNKSDFELSNSSLIAVFTPSLSRSQISQLMYLMYCLGQASVFRSSLYSEIDDKAVLNLLSNIKPAILNSNHFTEMENQRGESYATRSGVATSSSSHEISGRKKFVGHRDKKQKDCAVRLEKINLDKFLDTMSVDKYTFEEEGSVVNQNNASPEEEESSINEIHLKEEPLDGDDDGFRAEIIILNEANNYSYVRNGYKLPEVVEKYNNEDDDGGDDDDGSATNLTKPRHKPGILGKRKKIDTAVSPGKRRKYDMTTTIRSRNFLEEENSLLPHESQHQSILNKSPSDDDGEYVETRCLSEKNDDDQDDAREEDSEETRDASSEENNKDLEIFFPDDSENEIDFVREDETVSSSGGQEDLVLTGETITVKCPITQQVMVEPVRNKICGHSYDKIGAEQLMKHRGKKARCPVPGCKNILQLELCHLETDIKIKEILSK